MNGAVQGGKVLAAATMALFAVAGPPSGAVALAFLLPLFIAATAPAGYSGGLPAIFGMTGPAVVAPYWAGVIQATVMGFAVSACAMPRRFPRWRTTALFATAAWAAHMVLGPSRDGAEMALLWPAHVVPALLCARLAAPLWRPAP